MGRVLKPLTRWETADAIELHFDKCRSCVRSLHRRTFDLGHDQAKTSETAEALKSTSPDQTLLAELVHPRN